jgi:flagellar biosynthesis protein FliR
VNEILPRLTELATLAQSGLWGAALVFLRLGALMALLPAFGEQVVPLRVRLALTLAFTAIVYPAVAPDLPLITAGIARPVLAEVVAGLALGIALRLMVVALQIAGTIAAQATNLSQMVGGASAEPQPAMGHVLVWAGLALAVATDLHVRVAELAILSYQILPSGTPPSATDLSSWGLGHVTQAFRLGFSIAAPFVIASLVYNLALGVINRAMPQLMVSFVGAPALTLGGLAMLALAAPLALSVWLHSFSAVLADPLGLVP